MSPVFLDNIYILELRSQPVWLLDIWSQEEVLLVNFKQAKENLDVSCMYKKWNFSGLTEY